MYSGTLDSKRYSRLDQIHNRNVGNLELKWAYQIPEIDRAETTPLVVDGVMFVTEAPSNVVALDAATGRQYWRYDHELPDDLRICCGRNNRGVAILGETLFMSTLDAHIVAIDARTGNLVWDTETAPHASGYSKTAAPLIVKDQVITGIAGGEYGIRGFLDSYDAASGARNWRTYTIPGPDEPGNQTWLGESWRTGGSPTWITGAYDPDLDLIYWGTGNPGPDWNGEVRLGDNLYSDSVLALNGEGGNLEWYFQFTPHDIHDWDAIQVPIIGDIMYEGEMRKVMMWANRNAFYYTLDRETGEFLVGKPYALQTWAEGLDENGRPIRVPNMEPSVEGKLVSPTIGGGTNWWSPTFSPRTGLYYVNAFDGEQIYFIRDEEYVEGEQYTRRRRRERRADRQLPQRGPRHRSGDGRHPLGVRDRPAVDLRTDVHRRRPRLRRHRGRLLLRHRRGQRRGAVAHDGRGPRALGADQLRGRRPAVRLDRGGQRRLHVRPRRLRHTEHRPEPPAHCQARPAPARPSESAWTSRGPRTVGGGAARVAAARTAGPSPRGARSRSTIFRWPSAPSSTASVGSQPLRCCSFSCTAWLSPLRYR